MPYHKARNNRNRGNQSTRRTDKRLVEQVKILSEIERTQQRSLPPVLRDVQKVIMPRERVMIFERMVMGGTITPNAMAPTFGSNRITLGSLPDYTEFTSLFDAYRIAQMTVTFFPTLSMSGTTTAPTLYTVIDYDDDTAFTAVAPMLEYPSLMQSVAGTVVERTFNPYAANAAYSGTFTGYARMPRSTWVDAASPDVRYYGLKWAVDAGTAVQTWTIQLRVIVHCKNVR